MKDKQIALIMINFNYNGIILEYRDKTWIKMGQNVEDDKYTRYPVFDQIKHITISEQLLYYEGKTYRWVELKNNQHKVVT